MTSAAAEVETLREELRNVEIVNGHLRDQLREIRAQRVRIQGYLFKYKAYTVGLFKSPWRQRYFSLVDDCLKCFSSEETTALIPENEIFVQGYSTSWEGKKRGKFWTFGLKDKEGCVAIRLSTTEKPTAVQWISCLSAAGVGSPAPKRELPRMRSLPIRASEPETAAAPSLDLPDEIPPTVEIRQRRRSMAGSTPVHLHSCASILSSERLFQHPHPGILNLGIVILFAANFRLVLENVFKYGLRVNPFKWFESLLWGSSQPLMLCWPVLGLCTLQSYLIEQIAVCWLVQYEAQIKKSETPLDATHFSGELALRSLHICNLCCAFLLPMWLVYISVEAVLSSFVLTFVTLVVCMKLISYVHCNADLRQRRRHNEDRAQYPDHLSVGNLFYFMVAPTLTYQTSYPRSERIRGKWLLRRCGELILALALQVAIIDQYIFPAVENSMRPLEHRQSVALVERVLKLSLPMLYAWLIMFYIFFHLWLNILAELLRFGDREFYRDWWNALNLADYWKTWNTPVHKWMLRTIYYPAIHAGLQRSTAMLLVFFVSALLHEVVVMIPLKFSSHFPWSFVGMLFQVPLIFFSQFLQKKFGDRWGNIIFWVSFCVVGQPVCLLYYYYDWIHAVHET